MPQTSNTGAELTSEETAAIVRAFTELKEYVAALDSGMTPVEMTKVVFTVAGQCYHVKDTIDKAFKAANIRLWKGSDKNVTPFRFRRAVSPISPTPEHKEKSQRELLASVGITTLDELNKALAELGLPPKEGTF